MAFTGNGVGGGSGANDRSESLLSSQPNDDVYYSKNQSDSTTSRHSSNNFGTNHDSEVIVPDDGAYKLDDDGERGTSSDDGEMDVYYVKQRRGYCSIAFSLVQTIVLAIMMWQCGVAPLNINPMVGPYPDALNVSTVFKVFITGMSSSQKRLRYCHALAFVLANQCYSFPSFFSFPSYPLYSTGEPRTPSL